MAACLPTKLTWSPPGLDRDIKTIGERCCWGAKSSFKHTIARADLRIDDYQTSVFSNLGSLTVSKLPMVENLWTVASHAVLMITGSPRLNCICAASEGSLNRIAGESAVLCLLAGG
ncbi:hypothetical protein ABIC60_004867 [Phyllobacterium ifriqiyense]